MGIILWIIIGGVIGWLATIVTRTDWRFGIIGNIIVGIIGAFLGGLIFSLLGLRANRYTINGWSLLVAFIGAVVALLIFRAISGYYRKGGYYSRY